MGDSKSDERDRHSGSDPKSMNITSDGSEEPTTDNELDSDMEDQREISEAGEVDAEDEIVLPKPVVMLSNKKPCYFLVPLIIIVIFFFTISEVLATRTNHKKCDIIIFAAITSHLVTYVVTHWSITRKYETLSLIDGYNIFPVKAEWNDFLDDATFKNSRVYDSINDSVCGRGSTMNKLMIGTGYSIGLTIYMKFYNRSNDPIDILLSIGGLSILLTSIYENSITVSDSSIAKKFYITLHYTGIMIFMFIPWTVNFIWFNWFFIGWSVITIIIMISFVIMMKIMNRIKTKRPLKINVSISRLLITLESVALISQVYMYICY